MLECVAIPFSRGSSWPRNQSQVSGISGQFSMVWATEEALTTQRAVLTAPKPLHSVLCFCVTCLPHYSLTATIDLYFFYFHSSVTLSLINSPLPFILSPSFIIFFISYENSTRIVSFHKSGSSFPWDDFAWILMYCFYSLNVQFVLIFIFPVFERSLSVILQVMTKGLKTRIYTGDLTFLCKYCVHRITCEIWEVSKVISWSNSLSTFTYSAFTYETFRMKNP